MMYIQPVVEDIVQELILIKLFQRFRPDATLYSAMGKRGNSYIRQRMKGFNAASRYTPHVVLTDLDNIACPPELIDDWINFTISSGLMFRIAVREAEAWLLADRNGFARFIGISGKKIPMNCEEIQNPKEFIVTLARRSSKRTIRADIVPEGISSVGPGYNPKMEEFILNHWNIENAISNSRSLGKAVHRIREFNPRYS